LKPLKGQASWFKKTMTLDTNVANGKFCCFAIQTRVSESITGAIRVGSNIYASREKPFHIDEWWQQQLGELEIADIERCSLFLTAQTSSAPVDVPELNSLLHSYYYALLLQGVGYARGGILLGGENSATGMRVTSIGWLANFYEPWKVLPNLVNREHLEATRDLFQGIETIYTQTTADHYLRLRKGFNAFLSGIRFNEAHNRLHQFVRAIDGVIKPRKGEGTNKFKYRCGFFAGRKPQHAILLEELYDLRSAAEHLNPLNDNLNKYAPHERDKIKALRTYQAELLAAFVYRKILTTPTLLSNFIDDSAIDQMWKQNASQLIALWGNTIDLQTAPNGLFLEYL
jgi:hypothetical protein